MSAAYDSDENEKASNWENAKSQFIKRTDRHSLRSQIASYVRKAEEVERDALHQRRECMRNLLESEQTVLEQEFQDKVKNSVLEDIKNRRAALKSDKERLAAETRKFVQSTRRQQILTNCYEIREIVRRRETEELKKCQREQIVEKERALRNQLELDKYWADVTQMQRAMQDNQEREEEFCRHQVRLKWANTLRQQSQQVAVQKKLEAERFAKEVQDMAKERYAEERDKLAAASHQRVKYRNELLQQIDEHNKRRAVEKLMQKEFQCKALQEARRLEEIEKQAAIERIRAARQSQLEFMRYARRVQQYRQQKQKIADDRYRDQYLVETCTKSNIGLARARKAKENALYREELLRQACEQKERRILEEKALHGGITENVFVKDEPTPEMVKAMNLKYRKELEAQMEDIKRQRKLAEERHERDLENAMQTQALCEQLAKEFEKDGIDFLQPHPFWIPIACAPKRCRPKNAGLEDPPAEGFGVKPTEIAYCNAGKENIRPGEFGDAFFSKF